MIANVAFWCITFLFFFQVWINQGSLPVIWPDEVLFFSPAYSLATQNVMATEVLDGLIPGMESKTLWMPPNFIIILGSLLKVFPDSLLVGRYLNIFSFFCSALIFIKILDFWGFDLKQKLCGYCLILWEPLLFRFGGAGRMEGLTALFFLLSLYLAISKRDNIISIFFSGFFVSMSFLAHPIGGSLGLVSFLYLILNEPKKIKTSLLFGTGAVLPIVFWIAYIHPDWNLFLIQFGSQLTRKKTLFESFTWLDKVKVFAYGFTFSKLKLSLFFIQLGIIGYLTISDFKKFGKFTHQSIFYWIWISVVFFSLYSSSEGWYVVHSLFPLAFGFVYLYKQLPIGKYIMLGAISLTYFGLIYNHYIHWQKYDTISIQNEQFSKLGELLQNSKNIYIQSIPDPYFYLRSKIPGAKLYEFIPGELEIPTTAYQNTIRSMDAFVFYEESLMNQTIKSHLSESKDWRRVHWQIPVSSEHWMNFKTTVFIKNPVRNK